MARSEIGYTWIAVIVAIFQVMLIWGLFNDLVTNLLYNLALGMGGNEQVLDLLIMFWTYFPIPFLFSLIIWAVVVSVRNQEDTMGL